MTEAATALKAQTLANRPRHARHDAGRGDGAWEHDRGYDRRGRPGYAEAPRERGREDITRHARRRLWQRAWEAS